MKLKVIYTCLDVDCVKQYFLVFHQNGGSGFKIVVYPTLWLGFYQRLIQLIMPICMWNPRSNPSAHLCGTHHMEDVSSPSIYSFMWVPLDEEFRCLNLLKEDPLFPTQPYHICLPT